MIKNLKFSEVVNMTLKELMKNNKKIAIFGLGVDDPKAIFDTTKGLQKIFGNNK